MTMWFKESLKASRMALTYVTVGTMTVIWSGVWYVYLLNNPAETQHAYYWCTGFLVTGLALVLIGLGLGWIGRSAQAGDLPAEGAPFTVVNAQQPNATAPALVLVARTPTTSAVAADGQVAVAPPQPR
jgi:hypothetical protein